LKIFHSVTPSTRLPSGKVGKTYYYSVTAVGASSESVFSAFVAGKR